jgi:hypothetical protein
MLLAGDNSFRLNMLMNDRDPPGPRERRHLLQLVPERGSEGSRPRVKVVLQEWARGPGMRPLGFTPVCRQ